jgi:hypothetical protein
MADQDYFDELLYTPQETTFGLPAQIIAKNLPAVVNPYGSTGSNLAAVVGGGLLAGLLQYGAKREAEAANRELAPRLLDVMGATSQDQLAQKLAQPGYERLAGLGGRLSLAMAENQRKQAIEDAKQKAELDRQQKFKLYESTLMNNPQVQQALRTQKGIEFSFREPKEPKEKKDWFKEIPGQAQSAYTALPAQVKTLKNLAERFRKLNSTAATMVVAKQLPQSETALAVTELNTLVPGIVKLLGDTGNLAVQEQENVKKETLGDWRAGSETIAKRLEQLAKLANTRQIEGLQSWKTAIELGGDAYLAQVAKIAATSQASNGATPSISANAAIPAIAAIELKRQLDSKQISQKEYETQLQNRLRQIQNEKGAL